MGIQKGTKLTNAPKDKSLKVRIDAETEKKLLHVCEATKKGKSEIVRNGIDLQYAEVRKND